MLDDIYALISDESIYEPDLEDDFLTESLYRGEEDYNGLQILLRQTMQHPILSKEQEHQLFKIIQNGASEDDRIEVKHQLILHNQRLVLSQAKLHSGRGLPLEDLIQEGNIGLIIALDKFDPDKGFKFSTYAIWWVRQLMQRAIRNKGTNVRRPSHVYEQYYRLQKTREQLLRFLGKEPSKEELVEASGMSKAKVENVMTMLQVETYLDTEVYDEDDDGTTGLDFIVDENSAIPAEIVSERVFDEQFSQLISESLDEREAFILKHHFGLFDSDAQSLAEIGKELGISRQRVRQIEEEVFKRIKTSAASSDSLTEAIAKLPKTPPAKLTHCFICGRKLTHFDYKYCSDQCRRKVAYEYGGIKPKEIRAQRKALMLTQRQLAQKIGVTKETIGSWERGVNKPSFEHYDKLCSFFEQHKAEILTSCQVTGNRLREFRQELGWSQQQLADFLDVSTVTLRNWEHNYNQPDFFYQRKLAEMFEHPDKLVKLQAPQLMLFDASVFSKGKNEQKRARKRKHKAVPAEVQHQLALW